MAARDYEDLLQVGSQHIAYNLFYWISFLVRYSSLQRTFPWKGRYGCSQGSLRNGNLARLSQASNAYRDDCARPWSIDDTTWTSLARFPKECMQKALAKHMIFLQKKLLKVNDEQPLLKKRWVESITWAQHLNLQTWIPVNHQPVDHEPSNWTLSSFTHLVAMRRQFDCMVQLIITVCRR